MFAWVYHYRYWDAERQEQVVSREMFTVEAIRAGLGVPVFESGKKVRADEVDRNGRLKQGSVCREREN